MAKQGARFPGTAALSSRQAGADEVAAIGNGSLAGYQVSYQIRGQGMKYVAIAGCSLGLVMSMVVGSLITPGAALADLRVDDRVESRGERREDRRENVGDGVEDRSEFREERRDCVGEGPDCRSDNRQDKREDRRDRGVDRVEDRGERLRKRF